MSDKKIQPVAWMREDAVMAMCTRVKELLDKATPGKASQYTIPLYAAPPTEIIAEQAAEIERLKTELAERRRRMEVMRSYMADYPTRGLSHFDNFIEMNENSSGWWNAEGRAK